MDGNCAYGTSSFDPSWGDISKTNDRNRTNRPSGIDPSYGYLYGCRARTRKGICRKGEKTKQFSPLWLGVKARGVYHFAVYYGSS